MADFTIYLGNKNYFSWSLRPWLVLKQTGVPFDEIVIPLYEATSKATIMKYSPSGTVPALKHGELVVWDSLAICEYLAESFPTFNLWPRDHDGRAVVGDEAIDLGQHPADRVQQQLERRRDDGDGRQHRQPAFRWAGDVEDRITASVHKLVKEVRK